MWAKQQQSTKWLCNAAKQVAEQTSPVLSIYFAIILPPTASTGLSHALFLRSQGACYSSRNSTWQGDLCPTQDGLNWGGRGGGSDIPCPALYDLCSALPPTPTPRPHCWPARGEEGSNAGCPFMLGPLLDSREGKETRQGEAHSNARTKSPVYV